MIEPGKLDRRVDLETRSESVDAMGSVSQTWTALDTVWASIRHLKGREAVEAREIVSDAETVFTIRDSSDVRSIGPSDRITYGGDVYQILSTIPIPGGRPDKIEILTKRRR